MERGGGGGKKEGDGSWFVGGARGTMTSSVEGFRFNGVAMIRQWSRRPEFGNEGKRTCSIRRRVFWRDLSGEITSHARPRWHHDGEREGGTRSR